jgi:hypothetical protein
MKMNNLIGLIAPQLREPSVCEACGEQFGCGATLAGCWCSELKLSDETRAELRERYQSCLCRTCLESFASQEKKEQADSQNALPTSPSEKKVGTSH